MLIAMMPMATPTPTPNGIMMFVLRVVDEVMGDEEVVGGGFDVAMGSGKGRSVLLEVDIDEATEMLVDTDVDIVCATPMIVTVDGGVATMHCQPLSLEILVRIHVPAA